MSHAISGIVVKGKGYGRQLGFPTVNLETQDQKLPPPAVYAGEAMLDGAEYKAGIVVNTDGVVEAHLIGYTGDAYGSVVTVEIKKFLREFKKFDSEEELIAQIKKDIEMC